MIDIILQIQEVQKTPNSINTKKLHWTYHNQSAENLKKEKSIKKKKQGKMMYYL